MRLMALAVCCQCLGLPYIAYQGPGRGLAVASGATSIAYGAGKENRPITFDGAVEVGGFWSAKSQAILRRRSIRPARLSRPKVAVAGSGMVRN